MGSGGSFVAILLSVPLTAVALVGVVGMPKLQEILSPASSHGDNEFDPDDGFSPRYPRSKRGGGKSNHDDAGDAGLWDADESLEEDLDDGFGSKPRSSKPKTALSRGGKQKDPENDLEPELEDDSSDFFKKPARSRPGQTPREPGALQMASTADPFKLRSQVNTADHVTPAPTSSRPDNFAAGIEKLRSLGVEQFHLVPGMDAGQVLFVCQVASEGEAGTVHRFEAESADPSAAVADVTRQLMDWQAESSVTKTAGAEFRR